MTRKKAQEKRRQEFKESGLGIRGWLQRQRKKSELKQTFKGLL